jgi:hypothetical protein
MDGPSSERLTTPEFIEALTTTLANARNEGDPYKSLAEKHLGALETILKKITHERDLNTSALGLAKADLEKIERKTESLLFKHATEIWENLGCPDYDPIYNILFPSSAPKSESFAAQAEQLSVIAELLKSRIHSQIDPAQAERAANEMLEIAEEFQTLLSVFSKHTTRERVLATLEASVARTGLLELSSLRRALRNLGLDDTRIKSVVPPPVPSSRGPASQFRG